MESTRPPVSVRPSDKARRPPGKLFVRHAALPAEHGAWVFLLSPLIAGLAAGGSWNLAGLALTAAALGAFLVRQPVTLLVKVVSGRRPRRDLPAALFWMTIYGSAALLSTGLLVFTGYAGLLWLAVPAIPALIWHLALISRRGERRQMAVEILGAGALALAAPAAYWVGRGSPGDLAGWILWLLCWMQSAGSIIYAYLRLEQRRLERVPARQEGLRMAAPALAASTCTLAASALLSLFRLAPVLVPLAFAVQWGETLWGSLHPAVGVRPVAIGVRQLLVSTAWTIVLTGAYLIHPMGLVP